MDSAEIAPGQRSEVGVELVDGRDPSRELETDDGVVTDPVEMLSQRPQAVAVGGDHHYPPGT